MIYEISHRITGIALFALECESMKVCAESAVRVDANLGDAYLSGANLGDANLSGADLSDAWVIDGGQDKRGYRFACGQAKDGTIQYKAGCKKWTSIDEARAHYGNGYSSDGDVAECLARLELMRSIAERRWPQTKEAAA